jgi:hypothetical protein
VPADEHVSQACHWQIHWQARRVGAGREAALLGAPPPMLTDSNHEGFSLQVRAASVAALGGLDGWENAPADPLFL